MVVILYSFQGHVEFQVVMDAPEFPNVILGWVILTFTFKNSSKYCPCLGLVELVRVKLAKFDDESKNSRNS